MSEILLKTYIGLHVQYRLFLPDFNLWTPNVNYSWRTAPLTSKIYFQNIHIIHYINPLTPNDHYSGRTAPLNSKSCILYIYSTNIGTEYLKNGIYSPFFFPFQNSVCFIILTYLVPVLFTFYIQGVLKLIKIIPAPKG